MFLGYIHYFRALAILFIITGHTIDVFVWNDIDTERLLRIFLSNGSVLFVFIAGYLFQHLSSKFDSKKYFKSKLKNVIAPYFIISIPAIVIFVTILKRGSVWYGFYDNSILEQIGLFYLTGAHLAPLWFIPMIAIFYVIAPLLIKADKNKLIYLGLPIFIVLSCFIGRGFPPQSFIHFFSAYLLGMYCSQFKDVINPIISRNILIVFSFSLIIFFSICEFLFLEGTMTYINYLQKLSMSIFFLGLFIKFNSYLNSKFVSVIADTSFGVFFIHSYLLTSGKLLYLKVNGEPATGNLVLYFIVAITTLLTCSYIITLVKKVSGKYSKLLVGS
ncbi:acyltransferase family protein [Thalassotalea hakodatensis]|uniref:acyltransferase family protein n=1 Tax=Thalassotalea hakodatensis TaxID=3030492 RepID=UPI0025741936|nr:acyltransferase [Thalassotalea hakodatensis]